ncbi:IS1 family transposase [Hymenobacter sp. GOD-10R]|uniref:IS1 family transposase n=1 Tax=Hymenobacter sp. GOD-10R TaxID=3093922 RepID=UPI002D786D0C|nr:IS1 family transposase [Hymenobacter sp. GOD-10R]WRQ27453.1 IS1 family transposase [Hymenobacter sp. GOD-10R]
MAGRRAWHPAHRSRVLGCRGQITAKRLWQALPRPYRTTTWYYTDELQAYHGVLPKRAHQVCEKGSRQTSIVEAINCSLRQRCSVLVRRFCSFSRSLTMHQTRIQLVVDEHNRRLTSS